MYTSRPIGASVSVRNNVSININMGLTSIGASIWFGNSGLGVVGPGLKTRCGSLVLKIQQTETQHWIEGIISGNVIR